MIINVQSNNLPLCPNQGNPVHPLHAFHVNLQNAAYNSNPKDENFEFETVELTKMYEAIAYQRFSGRMYLYHDTVIINNSHSSTTVHAWYFRCSICGLILPAQAQEA